MFRISIIFCSISMVLCIIVTDPPPSETDYKYAYDIEDPSTGDSKSQHEVRQGDVVTGAYSVVGPDGTKRTVEYTADSKHGFKAVLREEPAMDLKLPIQHTPEVPVYYDKLRLVQKPYVLAQGRLPIPYARENQDIVYFVPANEVKSYRQAFLHGKYFEPAA